MYHPLQPQVQFPPGHMTHHFALFLPGLRIEVWLDDDGVDGKTDGADNGADKGDVAPALQDRPTTHRCLLDSRSPVTTTLLLRGAALAL